MDIRFTTVNNSISVANLGASGVYTIESSGDSFTVSFLNTAGQRVWHTACESDPERVAQWHYDKMKLEKEFNSIPDKDLIFLKEGLMIKSD